MECFVTKSCKSFMSADAAPDDASPDAPLFFFWVNDVDAVILFLESSRASSVRRLNSTSSERVSSRLVSIWGNKRKLINLKSAE